MKIPVKLKDNETELQTMVEAFEELFDNIPPIKILGYSHYDLHKKHRFIFSNRVEKIPNR